MTQRYPVKRLPDGRAMLNLGCGYHCHWGWVNVDFSPYARLAHHPTLGRLLNRAGILSGERYSRLRAIDPEIVRWDLRKGIPFADASFDVVYHSHVFEHIPREFAIGFLRECYRVLKPDGVLRVVVPDLRVLIDRYNAAVSRLEAGDRAGIADHQETLDRLFDQMVRSGAAGTAKQKPGVQLLERLLRGGADAAGELHRWMYDRFSLEHVLRDAGFRDVQVETHETSRIPGWNEFRLDVKDDGSPYKSRSLYMEGLR